MSGGGAQSQGQGSRPQPTTAAAYRSCEAITRRRAANFYYGIRLLRGDQRRAMCAVYAFARRVDDIGDGSLAGEEKRRLLDAQARALDSLARWGHDADAPAGAATRAGLDAGDPVLVALADAQRRFPLASQPLGELIDGVRMDVDGVAYERFEELVVYCRRVAGAIGRACLQIFGARESDPERAASTGALADDLGVALQLTNILRDLREDAQAGRVYLPGEDLRRFGVLDASESPAASMLFASLTESDPRLDALIRFEAARARDWFRRGMQLVPLLDRRSAACVLAMAGIYRRLLARIETEPHSVLRERVSLPAREKAYVAARSMLGGGG